MSSNRGSKVCIHIQDLQQADFQPFEHCDSVESSWKGAMNTEYKFDSLKR